MTENPCNAHTLPCVAESWNGKQRKSRLILTISFHPDTSRIGDIASFPLVGEELQWELGRNTPNFYPSTESTGEKAGRALEDPYLSRQALHIEYRTSSLVLARKSSSRCQVNGVELDKPVRLGSGQLQAGVVLLLSHRVVIVLRETPWIDESSLEVPLSAGLIGGSPFMGNLRKQIRTIAATDLDVLIRGETGTGKELVASAIHANCCRSHKKMVTVNMSAIPPALAPAALFGSAKGAYTGADTAGVGYFEQAQGGVLFLDEVGDTPTEMQAQLLRALQQREIQPVGGSVRRIDLRVIAATDAPLEDGQDFKAALRHRLGGCEIVLQPLRQHPEDIGELLWFYLENYIIEAKSAQLLPGPDSGRREIAAWAELFYSFVLFSWPGNVRQLSNFARRIALASDGALLLEEDLHELLSMQKRNGIASVKVSRKSVEVSEQEFMEAMASVQYEPKGAARLLNISRTAVYRRIEESSDLLLARQIAGETLQAMLANCAGDVNKTALHLRVSPTALRNRLRSINS